MRQASQHYVNCRGADSGAVLYRRAESSAADSASGRRQVQSQRDGLFAGRRVKNEQDRDAMIVAVGPIADAGIAFNDETIIGKSAEIVEAMEVGPYLTTNAFAD